MILPTRWLLFSLPELISLREGVVLIEAELHFVFVLCLFRTFFSLLEDIGVAHLVVLLCEFLQPADLVGVQ